MTLFSGTNSVVLRQDVYQQTTAAAELRLRDTCTAVLKALDDSITRRSTT